VSHPWRPSRREDLEALIPQRRCLSSVTGELIEEGRLADARLTSHHQAASRPAPCPFDEVRQACLFEPAAD
jgi:hypothetical protein